MTAYAPAQTETTPQPTTNGTRAWIVRVAAGPVAFLIVQSLPLEGLKPAAHYALSCYAWVLAWWVATPIPWAVTGMLPLVLFPIGGAMSLADTAGLYGQRVLPFLIGVMLFGHAFSKHGLATRMATAVLSIPGIATSGPRLIFIIMVLSAIISSLVDDAPTVAIMIPMAVSVAVFAGSRGTDERGPAPPRFLEAACLAVLYGSAAGGLATPAGVPFNPMTISILNEVTGYDITFTQWTMTGIFLAAAAIPAYYLVLMVMARPEVGAIADSAAHFREQNKSLGPLTPGERNVLIVLVIMVALWFSPAIVAVPVLDIWFVPPVAILLLFLLPVNTRAGEMTLGPKDFQEGVMWNVLFMVVSGTALAAALARLGVTEWLGMVIRDSGGISAAALPWFAALITPVMSHLTSGTATTATISTLLYPIANDVGYNSAILARVIAGTALAVSFPWGGAASGSAFASGRIRFGQMVRIGIVITIVNVVIVTILSVVLVPAFGAYSAP